MIVLLTLGFFGLCMMAMAVGVMVSDRALRGSCGGGEVHGAEGEVISCGACPKKEADVCATDNDLAALASMAYPNPRSHHHG